MYFCPRQRRILSVVLVNAICHDSWSRAAEESKLTYVKKQLGDAIVGKSEQLQRHLGNPRLKEGMSLSASAAKSTKLKSNRGRHFACSPGFRWYGRRWCTWGPPTRCRTHPAAPGTPAEASSLSSELLLSSFSILAGTNAAAAAAAEVGGSVCSRAAMPLAIGLLITQSRRWLLIGLLAGQAGHLHGPQNSRPSKAWPL